MKNIIKLLIGLLVIGLIVFIVYQSLQPEKQFKRIELSTHNRILNGGLPTYYDTILNVAMEQMNIKGQTLVVRKISESASNGDGVTFDAHLRYEDNMFYLFTSSFDKHKSLTVLSHEIIHMDQYLKKDIIYQDGILIWKNEPYNLNDIKYEVRPWETDAFNREGELISKVKSKLY